MKTKLLFLALSILSLNITAQVVPNIDWVQYYSERAQISNVPSAIDANSNVYITGYTYPTPSNADLTTIKYDATGNIVWIKHYNNGGYDDANAITLDAASNVYVAGESDGTGTGRDLVVVKYDVNGNQLWASQEINLEEIEILKINVEHFKIKSVTTYMTSFVVQIVWSCYKRGEEFYLYC